MNGHDYGRLLTGAVDTVLETMFFSAPLGPAEPETGVPVVEARLAFRGKPCGTLEVCLSEASARLLAAGFLGLDEDTLSGAQPGQVVCELANMLCGSLVSRMESAESFDLTSPELVLSGGRAAPGERAGGGTGRGPEAPPVARQSFEIEHGILTVTLRLEAFA